MSYRDDLAATFGEISNTIAAGSTSGDASLLLDALASMSTSIALVVAGVVAIYMVYQGLFNTAVDGKFFGNTKEGSRFIIVALICAVMIMPPLGSGGGGKKDLPYSASQLLYLKAVVLGADFAQDTWDKYRPKLNAGAVVSSVSTGSISTSVDALSMLICAEYANHNSGVPKVTKTLGGISFAKGHCGNVSYPFSTPDNLKYAPGAKKAIDRLFSDLDPMAKQIVALINGKPRPNTMQLGEKNLSRVRFGSFIFEFPTDAEFKAAIADFRAAASRYDSNVKATVAKTIPASNAYDDWMKAGGINYEQAKRQRKIHELSETISTSIIYNPPSDQPSEFIGGQIRISDLTNVAHKIASQIIISDMKAGVPNVEFSPWSAVWNDGDGCLSCFSKHTAAALRSAVLSSFDSTIAPQLSMVELGNRLNIMKNIMQGATYVAAPARAIPIGGYLAEEVQDTFKYYIPKLELASNMLAVWAPRTPSTVWVSSVTAWRASTIAIVAVIPFAFILLMLFEQGSLINRGAKLILIAAAITVVLPTLLVLGVLIFAGLNSIVFSLFNAVYWADGISSDIGGISHGIADIQMYAWITITLLASTAVFAYFGYIVAIKKFVGSDNDAGNDAQQAANTHSSTASGTGGAMTGGGSNLNIKRGGNKISGK